MKRLTEGTQIPAFKTFLPHLIFYFNFNGFFILFRYHQHCRKGWFKHIDEQIIRQDIKFLDFISWDIAASSNTKPLRKQNSLQNNLFEKLLDLIS